MPMTSKGLPLIALALVVACSGRREPPNTALVRGEHAADATAYVFLGPQLPTGAVAAVDFNGGSHAIVAQVKAGRVMLLFPDDPENATARIRRPFRRSFAVDSSDGPVFVIVARAPMQLATVFHPAGFLSWPPDRGNPSEPADSTILRFADTVAEPRATVVRAPLRELDPGTAVPRNVRTAQRPAAVAGGRCYPAPVVNPPRPRSSDTAYARPDTPRDPAQDRVVCERLP